MIFLMFRIYFSDQDMYFKFFMAETVYTRLLSVNTENMFDDFSL